MRQERFSIAELVDFKDGEQFDFTLQIGLEEIEMRFISVSEFLNDVIYLNSDIKVITTVIFITFGGFSIHTQVKCILDEYGLDYKYFFKGRILQLIIAIILTFIP